jgi:hypothetical protein
MTEWTTNLAHEERTRDICRFNHVRRRYVARRPQLHLNNGGYYT